MFWNEYLKNHNDEDIDGNIVFITDIRITEGGNKFIRHIPPQKVMILSNEKHPTKKTIYYSDYHFRKMNGDKVLKQVIAPFDNTGYRSYSGIPVKVFDNIEDCIKAYNEMIEVASSIYDKRINELEIKKKELFSLRLNI